MNKKVLLIVIDGYGEGKDYPGNAVTRSKTPFLKEIREKYPITYLKASGESVGLPKGTMGGSEVGHYTIGAGRVVWQSLERINRTIKDKSFEKNTAIQASIKNVKKHNSTLHLVGMISDAGIHSHINHLFALIDLAKKEGLTKLAIHCITDGRDVPEKSAENFLKKVEQKIKKAKIGEIVSVIGRYYAMDRDANWQRSQQAYELMVNGKGMKAESAIKGLKEAYEKGDETDYYVRPIIINKSMTVKDNDSIIFFNFRTDRSKQLTMSFLERKKTDFKETPVKVTFTCFGPYSKSKNAHIAFPEVKIKNNLGEFLESHKLKQLRVAETEKYAHVTFFFNSQRKEPYLGEKQILVPSSKVASYSQKPEMSAAKVTKETIKHLPDNFPFILVNYANPDLVGHSGDFAATVKCLEFIDSCLEKLVKQAIKQNYEIIITADHGNAEFMKYEDKSQCPSHTLNKVFFILIKQENDKIKLKKQGQLSDVAPTIIELLGLKKPKDMTGESLIK